MPRAASAARPGATSPAGAAARDVVVDGCVEVGPPGYDRRPFRVRTTLAADAVGAPLLTTTTGRRSAVPIDVAMNGSVLHTGEVSVLVVVTLADDTWLDRSDADDDADAAVTEAMWTTIASPVGTTPFGEVAVTARGIRVGLRATVTNTAALAGPVPPGR